GARPNATALHDAATRLLVEIVLLRDQIGHEVLDRGLGRFADDRVLEVGRAEVEAAESRLATAAARAGEHQPAALRRALALRAQHDLARARVDHMRGNGDRGLARRRADLAEAELAADAAAAHAL